MRRASLILLIVIAAACSGGDDDAGATSTTTTEAGPAPTVDTTPPETAVAVDRCEDVPDPADYAEGAPPIAVRPCTAPTALVTHTIRDGVGREAQDGDTVIVDYVGVRAEDGAVFDQSHTRGVPLNFTLGRGDVIDGWDDGLIGVQAGSVVKLDVPAASAYGDTPPAGGDVLQPGDDLSFVVEVHAAIPSTTIDDAPLDLEIEPSVGATEVTTTVIREGEGAVAELGDTVVVHLMLVRGDNEVVLFNTYEASDPLQIVLADGQTLPGVFEALPGTQVGSMIAIAMPPASAFGDQGNSGLGLPAGTDLIAVVELVGVY